MRALDGACDLTEGGIMINLTGKRVLATGAAGGLGRAFAQAYSDAGARVWAADLDETGALQTMDGRAGGSGVMDVRDMDSCSACVAQAVAQLGVIDVLVNNAAFYAGVPREPFEQITADTCDKVMEINVKGTWQMCKAATPALRTAGGGSIVQVGSATVFSGSPHWMHYVASKGAVLAMSRVMAKELGPDGIRVNTIAPGVTMTDASLDHFEDARSYGAARAALGRNAEPRDIVGTALFLASDAAAFMTGQTLVVDGGKHFV